MSNYAREADGKLYVCVEKLERLKAYLDKINAANLKDIVWVHKGEPVEIHKDCIKEWSGFGLRNTEFLDYLSELEAYRALEEQMRESLQHKDNDV